MIYFGPLILCMIIWYRYLSFLDRVRAGLYENLVKAKEVYTFDRSIEFTTDMQRERADDPFSSQTGLFRKRPEFKKMMAAREQYLLALISLAEFSGYVLGMRDPSILIEDLDPEDNEEIWKRYTRHSLYSVDGLKLHELSCYPAEGIRPGRFSRFCYFKEFLRFEVGRPKRYVQQFWKSRKPGP